MKTAVCRMFIRNNLNMQLIVLIAINNRTEEFWEMECRKEIPFPQYKEIAVYPFLHFPLQFIAKLRLNLKSLSEITTFL